MKFRLINFIALHCFVTLLYVNTTLCKNLYPIMFTLKPSKTKVLKAENYSLLWTKHYRFLNHIFHVQKSNQIVALVQYTRKYKIYHLLLNKNLCSIYFYSETSVNILTWSNSVLNVVYLLLFWIFVWTLFYINIIIN
jgi:hypothetical protein